VSQRAACLAVIPARGGYKRIPGKSVRCLEGKPLVGHAVEAALESDAFDRVIVTTESREMAEVARECGTDAPLPRDPSVSDGFAPWSTAPVDAHERLDPSGRAFTNVCQLMPTYPLRTAGDILADYDQFVRTGAPSQVSVVRYGWQNPGWVVRRDERLILASLFEDSATGPSQDLQELLWPTGVIWWAKAHALHRERTYHMAGGTGWDSPRRRGVDIGTEADREMARVLMNATEPRTD